MKYKIQREYIKVVLLAMGTSLELKATLFCRGRRFKKLLDLSKTTRPLGSYMGYDKYRMLINTNIYYDSLVLQVSLQKLEWQLLNDASSLLQVSLMSLY